VTRSRTAGHALGRRRPCTASHARRYRDAHGEESIVDLLALIASELPDAA
jgi:hypothetical protein